MLTPDQALAKLRATQPRQTRKARKPTHTEAALKRAVMRALQLLPGVHVLRMQAGMRIAEYKGKERKIVLGEAGTPDVLVLLPNQRVVWLELKTAAGRVSPAQAAWHRRAHELGHVVLIVRDVQTAVTCVAFERDKARESAWNVDCEERPMFDDRRRGS